METEGRTCNKNRGIFDQDWASMICSVHREPPGRLSIDPLNERLLLQTQCRGSRFGSQHLTLSMTPQVIFYCSWNSCSHFMMKVIMICCHVLFCNQSYTILLWKQRYDRAVPKCYTSNIIIIWPTYSWIKIHLLNSDWQSELYIYIYIHMCCTKSLNNTLNK